MTKDATSNKYQVQMFVENPIISLANIKSKGDTCLEQHNFQDEQVDMNI